MPERLVCGEHRSEVIEPLGRLLRRTRQRSIGGPYVILVVSIAALLATAPPPAAFGATAPATLDESEVTLSEATDGTWSATVGITNLTDSILRIDATKDRSCKPKVGDGTTELPAAQHADLTVSIPAACKAADGLSFLLTARGDGVSRSFPITANP